MDETERDNGVLDEAEQPRMSPEQFIAAVVQSPNLAAELDSAKLTTIARQCLDDYHMDKASMSDWFEQMQHGLDLAKLVKEGPKSYPYDNAANIKYPLITSAALQFNARAYPAIVPSDQVVKAQTYGADRGGQKAARAERISTFMSWQLTSEIEEWEEETDRLLLQLPIVGTMVRKWWHDPISNRARCRLIEAGKFIVNDKVKNLADAPRCTEELPLFPVEIESRIRAGSFIQFEYTTGEDDQGPQDFIEHHTRIDLDEDGYPEPYIVTIHCETQTVVRMMADFAAEDVTVSQDQMGQSSIVRIQRGSYFVAHQFWPSLDGGFHGTGLGLLLGDISDAIDTIFNMLLDAGHYAAMGGGFIGSDFRVKGGNQRFRPGEWKLAQVPGGVIKDSIVPITFPGPDATLFQMLGMLIEAGREISSTKDIMTGDSGGKVQTATTTMALIEQGMMVFTAAYKRIFRALKQEFRLLAKINQTAVSPEQYNAFHDQTGPDGQPLMVDPAKDFDVSDMDVAPVADPRSVTKMQQAAKGQLLMDLAEKGMVDPVAAAERVMQSMDIPDTDALMPKPNQSQQMQEQLGMMAAVSELVLKRANIALTIAKIDSEQAKAAKDLATADATATTLSLEAIRTMLQHDADNLDRAISMAGMAGAPGNAGAPSGDGRMPAGAAGINAGPMVGGAPAL